MATETDHEQRNGRDCTQLNREKIMAELDEKGYCVIPNVMTSEECDAKIASYRDWLSQFGGKDWPFQRHSIIQSYRTGHFKATWETRLAAKKVFEEVWQTKKLLTSVDGVAISPPPPEEEAEGAGNSNSTFTTPEAHWLHLDQSGARRGLHCYQGAVYLEETSPTDYCFRVLEGSHAHTDDFYREHPNAARGSARSDFYRLKEDQVRWFKQRGCPLTKVPVPKGGMVLWDSRTIHDNCRPEAGRPNAGRWRFVVFVCMAPARWARPGDMANKKQAYRKLLMTSHWPCQRINFFHERVSDTLNSGVPLLSTLPEVARSKEVRQLAGALEYDFEDGEPNGPGWDPEWVR